MANNKILKSGTSYFEDGNTNLVTLATDATVISGSETPDIVPAWLDEAAMQFPSSGLWSVVDAPSEADYEAENKSLPDPKHLPPHP